jgi:hypothetical protein
MQLQMTVNERQEQLEQLTVKYHFEKNQNDSLSEVVVSLNANNHKLNGSVMALESMNSLLNIKSDSLVTLVQSQKDLIEKSESEKKILQAEYAESVKLLRAAEDSLLSIKQGSVEIKMYNGSPAGEYEEVNWIETVTSVYCEDNIAFELKGNFDNLTFKVLDVETRENYFEVDGISVGPDSPAQIIFSTEEGWRYLTVRDANGEKLSIGKGEPNYFELTSIEGKAYNNPVEIIVASQTEILYSRVISTFEYN